MTAELLEERKQWPSFHAGTAAAFSVIDSVRKEKGLRNWIMQHVPTQPSSYHGGFLLGLGFGGCLDSL